MRSHSIRTTAALALAGAAVLLAAGPARAQKVEVSLGQAFDSAAVVAALRELPAPRPGTRPLFTAVFVRGELKTVEPAEDGLPPAYAEPVAALLQAHARTIPGGESLRQIHLRVEGGEAARVSLHQWVVVPPQPVNMAQVQRSLGQIAARERSLRNAQEGPARGSSDGGQHTESLRPRPLETATLQIKMRVELDGSSTRHELLRLSNNPRINREALRLVQQLRFQPATVDGRAIRTWAILPINVQY